MSKFSKAFLQVKAGVDVLPPPGGQESGAVRLRQELNVNIPDPLAAWGARVWIPDNTVECMLEYDTGTLTGTIGTRQAGHISVGGQLTSSGVLNVVVTGAKVTGSPATVPVPLSTSVHTSAAMIAQAIADALNRDARLAMFEAELVPGGILFRSKWAFANDATLNVAIPAALGLHAAPNLTFPVAGSKGLRIERLGGDEKDALNRPLVIGFGQDKQGLIIANRLGDSGILVEKVIPAGEKYIPVILPGGFNVIWGSPLSSASLVIKNDYAPPSVCDILSLRGNI